MDQIIDADTHISEGEAMWAMMDGAMQPRRPVMLSVPEDTWYGNRNAFWLIDGEIYPKSAGKGSFALVTPSAQKVQEGRKDSTPATREMTDIPGRLADMESFALRRRWSIRRCFSSTTPRTANWRSRCAAPTIAFLRRHVRSPPVG